LWGATILVRRGVSGRPAALAATGFAIAGFCFGFIFTVQGGDLPDITYHAIGLVLLTLTLAGLVRTGRPGRQPPP
jgi:hypothetical protein